MFYEKLTCIYLEMPKYKKAEAELETNFDKWLYVLKILPNLLNCPERLQEKVFKKLFEVAEIANFTKEHRTLCQAYNSKRTACRWTAG